MSASDPQDRDDCPECDGTGLTLCPGVGLVECPECPPTAPRVVTHPAEVRWGVPEVDA